MWPYYALCKKVFGYRILKSKIIKKKASDFNFKEWATKEIKALISYVSQNFESIEKDTNNLALWAELSAQIGKDEETCKEKYLELRKSYKKLNVLLTRNPNSKITWKYYAAFDSMFSNEVDNCDFKMESIEGGYEYMALDDDIKLEIQESKFFYHIIPFLQSFIIPLQGCGPFRI